MDNGIMFENIISTLDTKRPSVGEQIYEQFLYDMMTGTITGHVGELNGKVVVPDEIKGVEIRTIGAGAFANCTGITSVEIARAMNSDINLVALKCEIFNSQGYGFYPQGYDRKFLKYRN